MRGGHKAEGREGKSTGSTRADDGGETVGRRVGKEHWQSPSSTWLDSSSDSTMLP